MRIRGKNVLLTGGSRGLGAALTKSLVQRGARVVFVARKESDVADRAQALRADGFEVHGIAFDVGEPDDAFRIVGAATALIGPIDIVIHNASTLGQTPLRPLAETSAADFARTLEVNLLGPFRITQAVVGHMVARENGLILHISSDAAVEAYANWGAYGVSKAALDHLGRIWSRELIDTGVRVASVDPGEMDTVMHAAADPTADRSRLASPADVAKRIADWIEAGDVEGRVRAAELSV